MKEEISLLDLLTFFRSKIKIILPVGIICAVIAFAAVTKFDVPVYTVNGSLLINEYTDLDDSSDTTLYDMRQSIYYAKDMLPTYVEVLNSKDFYDTVQKYLADQNVETTKSQLSSMISYSFTSDVKIIYVAAESEQPELAKKVVEAVDACAGDFITSKGLLVNITEISAPSQSGVRSMNRTVTAIIAFLIGAVLTYLLLYIINSLDTRVKSESDLTDKFDIPIIGIIPKIKKDSSEKRRGSYEE